jgi:hypothetical protein
LKVSEPGGYLSSFLKVIALERSPLSARPSKSSRWRLRLNHRRIRRVFSLACAGSLIFLGLVDFSFNAINGMYTTDLADSVLAAAINL